ncbi:cytosol aminopeptidase [bacterium MnTg02]|nr:cytosol aminopeptidase [bacterium MnTg02]
MTGSLDISFAKLSLPHKGVVVALTEQNMKLSGIAAELDAESGGIISRAAKIAEFTGKKKTFLDLLAPAGTELNRLIVTGLGVAKDLSENDWAFVGGAIGSKLSGRDGKEAIIIAEADEGEGAVTPEAIAHLALGLILRSYVFDKYKKKKRDENDDDGLKKSISKIKIQCPDPAGARKIFNRLKAVGEGVFVARDLVNEPANILDPEEFARRIKNLKSLGVDVEIFDEKALKKIGMMALLSVGHGSAKPSRVAVMHWSPDGKSKKTKPIAIVGKGVCFDTGGISLKTASGMGDMKGDMAGAACVVGLMHCLAARKAKVHVVGIVGLVENMPGSAAQRPGDIVEALSGHTIEVLNTDAEGRLVLADALWYTQDRFKPEIMVNLATLTGAVMVALGKEYAGLFSNNDELVEKLIEAGLATGEKVWRLPLSPEYDKLIDSPIADMKNIGGRWAGSITAAQFLQRFVNDVPWAHLDIAGTGMSAAKTAINQSWGPGYGVRLLDRLIADHYEK